MNRILVGLAYLVAHSLTEDPYGVVQRDLPRVLEALVSYLVALEALAQELEKETSNIQAAPSSTEEMKRYMMLRKQRESELIGELIGPLLTCGYIDYPLFMNS
jgi:nucleoporin NDC1